MNDFDRIPLDGSEARDALAEVRERQTLAADQVERPHRVTLVLRSQAEERLAEHVRRCGERLPHERFATDGETLAAFGRPAGEHLTAVEELAAGHGLSLSRHPATPRLVVLEGTLGGLAAAFRVDVAHEIHAGRRLLNHRGAIHVPRRLAGGVLAVLGFDERPLARPGVCGGTAHDGHVDPREVARAYDFPAGDGSGERVAVVLLGGGYHREDLELFLARTPGASPTVTDVSIDGAVNDPASAEALAAALEAAGIPGHPIDGADPGGETGSGDVRWTIEASLDVQLVGGLAPGADLSVVFAPPSIQGKVHAFSRLATDPTGPSVIACSWGGFESAYRPQDIRAMESIFAEAVARDVTLCFASGDTGDGSKRFGGPSEEPVVYYPAASPAVLACGGTTFETGTPEVSWYEELAGHPLASGGGYSRDLDRPTWQKVPGPATGRAVPDVAAKADIHNGYSIVLGGLAAGMGGTSAAAPVWGALLARCNQALRAAGHPAAGHLTPHLYGGALGGAFADVTDGDNGAYAAAAGWDPCTGWGTPKGEALLTLLLGD